MVSYNTANERDKSNINSQLGENPSTFNLPIQFNENISLKQSVLQLKKILINDSFILGSPTNGVLGTNMLGDRRTIDEEFVFPANNIVEEDLLNTTFINTDTTTATLNNDGTVNFTVGEILESSTVAKIRTTINSVKILTLDTTGAEITAEYSVDSGLTWIPITVGQKLLLTGGNINDDFKYKLTALGTVILKGPVLIQLNQ